MMEPVLAEVGAHVNDFYKGHFGEIWAINAFGVYRIKLEESKFDRLLYDLPEGTFASRNMCVDNGNNLWVVREGLMNLWKMDLDTQNYFDLEPTPKNSGQYSYRLHL